MATKNVKDRPHGMNRIQLLRWIKSNRTEFVEPPYEGMDDCWLYTGHKNDQGYGTIGHEGKVRKLHRLSLAEKLKRELEPWEETRHICDNPPCFNPRHLLVGTAEDNAQDRMDHGNHLSGDNHGSAKLTDFQVRRIRQMYASGNYTQRQLGMQFGVSNVQICRIVNRKSRNTKE